MLEPGRKGLSALIIGILLLSSLIIIAPTSADRSGTGEVLDEQSDGSTQDSGLLDETLIVNAPEPVDALGYKKVKGFVKVYVATKDVKELADFLEDYRYFGAIGNKANGRDEISFLLLEVPPETISPISQLEGVIGVHEYLEPVYPTVDLGELESSLKLSDNPSISAAQTGEGLTANYSGSNVKIAICDTGVDFAHLDLWGAYARDEMIFEVENETIVSNATADQTSALVGSSMIEVENESVVADATGGELSIHLEHRNIVPDSYTVSKNDVVLATPTDYALDIGTGYITLTAALVSGDNVNVTYTYYLVEMNIVPANYVLYKNYVLTSDYSLDLETGKISFTPTLAAGDVITADYSYFSLYYDWPIALDMASMDRYISTEGKPDNTFYVNTSIEGMGPFQSSHAIEIDGENDFSELEGFTSGSTPEASPIMERNFDLTRLYVTRDYDNWYFGFPTKFGLTDKTYTIYIDTDGSEFGGRFDPLGNLVDTNSSHTGPLNAVAYNPNGTWVASAGGECVKIWDSTTGAMLAQLTGWGSSVRSVVFSPKDDTCLAASDGIKLIIWNISQIDNPQSVKEIDLAYGGADSNANSVISFSRDGEYMAVGDWRTERYRVYILDIVTNTWEGPYAPATRPSARTEHAMCYDSTNEIVILFGGDDGALNNETWEYDAAPHIWTDVTGVVGPSARSGHAMCFDSNNDVVVLFGGLDANGFSNETWEYDTATNTWTNTTSTTQPSARSGHAMCFDTDNGVVVLFGGLDANGFSNETWEYRANTNMWTNTTSGYHPSARAEHAMCFDELETQVVVLFGGDDGTKNRETWEYRANTNMWTNVTGVGSPSARSGHAMCYDSSLLVHKAVLFGGSDGTLNDETWEYDAVANTWTDVTGAVRPSARSGHAMCYDSTNDVAVLFGGDDGTLDDETWEYNTARNSRYYVGANCDVTSVAFNPNGTLLAAGHIGDAIRIINVSDGSTYDIVGHTGDVSSVAWSNDGTRLISGGKDNAVKIWDFSTLSCLQTFTDNTGDVNSVDWSPDGNRLASSSMDETVKVWDATTYAMLANITGFTAEVNTVNFSSINNDLVAGSQDTKVNSWTSAGAYIRTFLSNLPDYVITVNYTREFSDDWTITPEGIVLSHNDSIENATVYSWNGGGWDSKELTNETVGGTQEYKSLMDATGEKIKEGFVELAVPRSLITGDPDAIEVEMFVTAQIGRVDNEVVVPSATAGQTTASLAKDKIYANTELYVDPSVGYAAHVLTNVTAGIDLAEGVDYTIDLETGDIIFLTPLIAGDQINASYYYYKDASHAQDTAPADTNVLDPNEDWSDAITSLSNFARREIQYYSIGLSGSEMSKSNDYHFGFHPGDAQIKEYGTLGVLVVDNRIKGLYERVYVDLNNDKVFDGNDIAVYKGSETTYIDEGGDDIPDYSAGTLYFIADGTTPIPYSDIYSERHGLLDRKSPESWKEWREIYVPSSGELVCFIGEFDYDEDNARPTTHGTMSAVVIAGRNNATLPQGIKGIAPNATIIAISNVEKGNIFEAWYFAVEGYDGEPGTGDEAVIVNNGFNYPKLREDGWDEYSRYADYISIEHAEGKALFVVSTGDDGYGYGTLLSPGACPGVVSVGAATDYYYKTRLINAEGPYSHEGDIASYSSRGPSALGGLKPDVLAIGTGVTDLSLNGDGGTSYLKYNEPWVGTDFSCAATVGALGMIYEAYFGAEHVVENEVVTHATENLTTVKLKHNPVVGGTCVITVDETLRTDYTIALETGTITFDNEIIKGQWVNATTYSFYNEYPDAFTARSLLMSGAEDMKNDVLCQGAGLINAERSIKLAENTDGLFVTPSSWVPGGYDGEESEAFVKLMHPGDIAAKAFSIKNHNSTQAVDPKIYDAVFQKFGEYEYSFTTTVTSSTTPDAFTNWTNIIKNIPASTELLKVTAHVDLCHLDLNGDSIIEDGPDFIYEMTLIDWNDQNGDGELHDTNYSEMNTYNVCNLVSNVLEVRVRNPLQRSHDGLFVNLALQEGMNVPSLPTGEEHNVTWFVKCEFYNRTDWDWLTTDKSTLTINGGETGSFTATMSVPDDAGVGSYEGAIYIDHDEQQMTDEPVVEYPTFHESDEHVAEYPTYHEDEEIANITINNELWEPVSNNTPTDAQLGHGNITGMPDIWKNGTVFYNNESMIYNTTGLELEEWWLYLPNENIINCSLYVSVEGEWIPLSEGGDYTLNYTTGNLTMLIGAPDPGWEFYAYYNYTITPVLLVMPGDYTLVYTTGAITLITPLVVGEYLTANYSWYEPILTTQLSHGNISACTLYLNGTVFANYELNSTTGLITFTPTLGPGDVVNASYDWYVPTLIQSALLNHTNIMPGSYTLYLNGTVFANYELNSTTGLITFTPTLGPGDVVNASYDWYVPTIINSALLENTNIVSGSCVLYNNTVVFTEYSIDLLSGAIFFDEPLWPGSSITADYSYYAHTITIPVLVNVPADRPEFTFGGGESTLGLFNNNEMIGGYGAGGQSGDWRFYYVDVADQGLNRNEDNLMKFFLNASWNLKPSDIDIFVFGKTAQTTVPGTGDALPSGRYGPYTLKDNGGSEETDEFYTTTNSSHEIITTPFTGGLNVVALHNTLINGTSSSEDVSGEVGWIRLSTDMLETRTNSLYGDASFSLVSNREFPEGMNVSAVGPASGEKTIELVDQDPVDWIESNLDFYHALTEGASLTKVIKVESVLTLDVRVWPVDEGMVPDVDLGMCYDANEDGVPTYEELVTRDFCDFISYRIDGYQPFQCSCADWDADEAVKLISPPDGQYIICVLGYEVKSPPQEVNLEIKAIRAGVEGFGMTGDVGEDIDIQSGIYTTNTSIPAFQTHTYSISWNFPGSTLDGEYGGVVGIGPSIAPSVLSILANLVLDRESPEITGPQPSDLSLIRENQPVIMATIEDLSRAEIDAEGLKLYVDGIDVTPLASVSVELDDEFGGGGYPRGIVTYTPNGQLSEGGHSVELVASDWAGNEVTRAWMFTVDTLAPALTISSDDLTYVNTPSATLQGTVETGCDLTISGVQGSINRYTDGTFTATLSLTEEENDVTFGAVDAAGNTIEIQRRIIYDTEVPVFDRVVALDGATTNRGVTGIYGEMSERGTLTINGRDVAVNSDGSFWAENIKLKEGVNPFTLEFTDLAGNAATRDMTITLDTIAPLLSIDAGDSRISTEWLNISGTTDADATLYINGKLIDVSSTRQGTGEFEHTVRLSYGANTIVIESKDRVGNVAQEILSVSYELESGTNWGAIGLMIMLLVVGLFVGILITRLLFGIPAEEEEYDEELEGEFEPEEGEEFPEMEEEMPEEMGEEPEVEDLEEVPESDITDAEPIPDEEAFPEEFPETEEEIPPEDLPDEDLPEPDEALDEDVDSVEADTVEPDEALDESATDAEPEATEEEALEAEEEDPRIAKLRQAFEDGKISEELYEKNLAKFKGE